MNPPARLGIILSMKGGLASFNYWELRALSDSGVAFRIYPTKRSQGPYVPESDWSVAPTALVELFLLALRAFFEAPMKVIRVIALAKRFRAPIDVGLAIAFAADMRKFRVGRVHVHFGDRKLGVAYFVHLLTGLEYSVVIHAHELHRNPNLALATRALAGARRIFTVSEYNAGVLESRFKIDRQLITVIGLPFDPAMFDIAQSPVRGPIVVLSIGRNVPKKGFDVLLDAVSRMPADDFELVIVGKDTEKLRPLVDRLRISDRVKLAGEVPVAILRREIARADIFCLASRTSLNGDAEGLPIALVEAMAAGKPIVSTKHTGIPELVHTELVPEGDPVQLAGALSRLLENETLRATEGKFNRDRVVRFHVPRTARYLEYLGAKSEVLIS